MNRKIEHLTHQIWRSKPLYPSTFSNCTNSAHDEASPLARGGGSCIDCLERELGELVGTDKAEEYVKLVKSVRELEVAMLGLNFTSERSLIEILQTETRKTL